MLDLAQEIRVLQQTLVSLGVVVGVKWQAILRMGLNLNWIQIFEMDVTIKILQVFQVRVHRQVYLCSGKGG